MDLLIAILLWIGCISAPGTYTTTQIGDYKTANLSTINAVYQDPVTQNWIWTTYQGQVSQVRIIDPFRD